MLRAAGSPELHDLVVAGDLDLAVVTDYPPGLPHDSAVVRTRLLEDEMCLFGLDGLADGRSPDRVDALVWALTELMLNEMTVPRVRGL